MMASEKLLKYLEETKMQKLLLILIVPFFLTACATEGQYSIHNTFDALEDCDEGGTLVRVYYGDSYLKIKSRISVKTGTGLKFDLNPNKKRSDLVDYEDMLVTIEAKTTDPDAGWIDVSGTYNDSAGALYVCAETDPGVYYYLVKVEEIGELDPRADVIN